MQVFHTITCPHCWQGFEVGLDISGGSASVVYDCEVCCNPLEIDYEVRGGGLSIVEVSRAQ